MSFRKSVKYQNQYFELLNSNDWLMSSERTLALTELMELCDDQQQSNLIFDLLDRFKFLKTQDYVRCLKNIANQIINIWKLPEESTQIVATTKDDSSDSAQAVLQDLKPFLVQHHWHKFKDINKIGKVQKNFPKYSNIVLVDEFAGTGETMLSRVNDCEGYLNYKRDQLNKKKQEEAPYPYKIYVCLVVAMGQAKSLLENGGVDLHSEIVLTKGISDHYRGRELEASIDRLLELESKLHPEINSDEFPSLGYKKTESLYTKEVGNTPNNVFPVFWWPTLINGEKRKTIVYRRESD